MRKKKTLLRIQSIGEILFKALKRRGLAVKLEDNAILKLWPKAVGSQIAEQSQPDCLRGGTLFVKTISSIWVQQLHFMKEDIRRKLNELAGKETIKEIRFTVGHELMNKRAKSDADVAHLKKSFLKERDKKMIADCTDSLADRELAAIFKRVMQVEINRRRWLQKERTRS